MELTGWERAALAYDAFEAWIAENDADGEMDLLDQIEAYYRASLCNET